MVSIVLYKLKAMLNLDKVAYNPPLSPPPRGTKYRHSHCNWKNEVTTDSDACALDRAGHVLSIDAYFNSESIWTAALEPPAADKVRFYLDLTHPFMGDSVVCVKEAI